MILKILLSKLTLSAFILTACSSLSLSQTTNAVRYQITPDALLSQMEKSPEKKEQWQARIKNELPCFLDMYMDSNRIIEVIRLSNDSISTIRIFQFNKSILLQIYPETKCRKVDLSIYKDLSIVIIDSTLNDVNVRCAYIEENNSFPLTACFIKDSLRLQRPLYVKGAAYPEHQVISNSHHFPIKIVHGNPKAFMTYDFLQTIEYSSALSIAIDAIIKKPKSKGTKKALFDLLSS